MFMFKNQNDGATLKLNKRGHVAMSRASSPKLFQLALPIVIKSIDRLDVKGCCKDYKKHKCTIK